VIELKLLCKRNVNMFD